ncbi:hypothetical protein C8R44DRAFT_988963 [Mycena epipterygia]|nr:hypothetical protein C8R44DRAFT_988963 [Mycena epipterygia]
MEYLRGVHVAARVDFARITLGNIGLVDVQETDPLGLQSASIPDLGRTHPREVRKNFKFCGSPHSRRIHATAPVAIKKRVARPPPPSREPVRLLFPVAPALYRPAIKTRVTPSSLPARKPVRLLFPIPPTAPPAPSPAVKTSLFPVTPPPPAITTPPAIDKPSRAPLTTPARQPVPVPALLAVPPAAPPARDVPSPAAWSRHLADAVTDAEAQLGHAIHGTGWRTRRARSRRMRRERRSRRARMRWMRRERR